MKDQFKMQLCQQIRCDKKAVVLVGFKLLDSGEFGFVPCCLQHALASVIKEGK